MKHSNLFRRVVALCIAAVMTVGLCTACSVKEKPPMIGDEYAAFNYCMYVKNGNIFLKGDGDPQQISSHLSDEGEIRTQYNTAAMDTSVSPDGNVIIFPENDGSDLYYKRLDEKDFYPVKIDSEVSSYPPYITNEEMTRVAYLAHDDSLYVFDLTDNSRTKIADGTINRIWRVSDDFQTFYFERGNMEQGFSLYKLQLGAGEQLVATDLLAVLQVYPSGEAYYVRKGELSFPLLDAVNDDMAKSDADMMAEPEMPMEEPSWYDYDTDEEYEEAQEEYDEIYEEFLIQAEKYGDKLQRDSLREHLESTMYVRELESLYYYNGSDEVKIADDISTWTSAAAYDTPVIAYTVYPDEIKKFNLSDIEDIDDQAQYLTDELNKSMSQYGSMFTAVKDSAVESGQGTSCFIMINDAGTEIYYMIPYLIQGEPSDVGDLYKISVVDGKSSGSALYDSDVCVGYSHYYYFYDNEHIVYLKDLEHNLCADVYVNGNLIDYDAQPQSLRVCPDQGKIYLTSNWGDRNGGTLKSWQNGELTVIAENVNSFSVMADGRIMYVQNYDSDTCSGELCEWKNGEAQIIDYGVLSVVTVLTKREHEAGMCHTIN